MGTPGHVPRERRGLKGYVHPVFTAALFTIARTWRQPKGRSAEMNKEDVVHVHSGALRSREKE